MHSGIFVEVLNTDAEGRMLLADALSFAKKFDPHIVIDIATLTGSARAAVGENASVIMGTAEQKYINDIIECGLSVHERLVQFPLWYDYGDMIKSDIADINNTGGLLAGAITAGKFLEKFTSYPWMHIDIGGSAYNTKGGDYRGKGATGMGVRLLYSFLNTCVSGLKG
jgi:leucyl aminopeptidase